MFRISQQPFFSPLILFQVLTPVELPSMNLAPKQEMPKAAAFTPPSAALKALSNNQKAPVDTNSVMVTDSHVSSSAAGPPPVAAAAAEDDNDDDEELDQLLSLQKPVLGVSGNQSVSVADEESVVPETGECIQHALSERPVYLPNLKRSIA